MPRPHAILVAACLCAAAPFANANPVDPADREWFGVEDGKPFHEWERLLGDLGGVRTDLEERGLSFGAANVTEYTQVLDGGVNTEDSFRNLFTFDVVLDTDLAFGLPGGTLFAQYLSVTAENGGSLDIGDIQVTSNIENDRSLDVLYELWYEQLLFDDRLRIKVGKIDANSEFAFVAPLALFSAAGELTNSSAGFTPSIVGFPSYPDPATAVNVFGTLYRDDNLDLTVAYGFFDGAAGADGVATGRRGPSTFFSDDKSNDFFHIAEAQLAWQQLGGLSFGSVSLGGWHHTGDFDTFDGGNDSGTSGFYATFQQRLTGDPAEDAADGLYIFGQFGFADGDVAEVEQHYAVGLVQAGLGSFRPDDAVGLYVSFVDLSDAAGAGFEEDETVVEAFYRLQITPAISVQPGLQFVINPSGDPDIDDALVGSLRASFTF